MLRVWREGSGDRRNYDIIFGRKGGPCYAGYQGVNARKRQCDTYWGSGTRGY